MSKIECPYCGKEYKLLTSHLVQTHDIKKEEFRKKYPEYPLITDECSNKYSKSAKGREKSKEEKEKISRSVSKYLTGRSRSEETKRKISESLKGRKYSHPEDCSCCFCSSQYKKDNPMYGKTYKMSKERKKKISESNKGKFNHSEDCECPFCTGLSGEEHSMYGKERPEEVKKKISESLKGRVQSEETKRKRAESMSKVLSEKNWNKPTWIENKMKRFLRDNNIRYKFQYKVGRYCVDFYLPFYRLVIECDGCYWHNCNECGFGEGLNERDIRKSKEIKDKGYNLLRVWEHDFKNDNYKKEVKEKIVKMDI